MAQFNAKFQLTLNWTLLRLFDFMIIAQFIVKFAMDLANPSVVNVQLKKCFYRCVKVEIHEFIVKFAMDLANPSVVNVQLKKCFYRCVKVEIHEYVFIRFRPLSRSFHHKHINYARICKIHCKFYNELCDNHKIKRTK